MKKLTPILLLVTVLMCSYKYITLPNSPKDHVIRKKSNGKKENPKNATVYLQKSLNGIDSADVETFKQDFDSNILKKVIPRAKVSVWFSIDIIKQMRNLLFKEQAGRSSSSLGVPDGFRLYFISQTSDKSDLSIAVVSTKNAGPYPTDMTQTWHKDYYYHDAIDPLYFPARNIMGEKIQGDNGGGAGLFRHCQGNCPDNSCVVSNHTISRFFGETLAGAFGNDVINTQSVWFDYGLLESILSVKMKKTPDGVRIYYGNYGSYDSKGVPIDSARDSNGNFVKKDRDTFIITLTEKGGKSKQHMDIFDCNAIEKTWVNFLDVGGALNNGELCPSHCN